MNLRSNSGSAPKIGVGLRAMAKNIILYSMMTFADYSQGIDNTNAHVLRWLQKRSDIDKIIFVDFNRFGWFGRLKYYLKNKVYKNNPKTVKRGFGFKLDKLSENVFHYSGFSLAKVREAVQDLALDNLEVWCFNPFAIDFLDNFPSSKKIFYAVDDWRQNNAFKLYQDLLEKNYKLIGQRADFIFVNGQKLLTSLWPNNVKAHLIPNGVDVDYFQHPERVTKVSKEKVDELLVGIGQKIVGYLGVMTPDRINFDLVEYIIKNNSDLYFVMAGPIWEGFNNDYLSRHYENVRFIGMMYYQDMPYLFSRFDVCLIPHQVNEFIQSMDPKKLYEYLAAGKPVVSTKVAGTEKFKDVIYIADNPESFSQNIRKALQENSSSLIESRQRAVIPHSWQVRFEEIESILNL